MTWIVVLLIITFLIGNLIWLMPSREERRRMKLRQKAYENKFRVSENLTLEQDGRWFDYILVKKHALESVTYVKTQEGWTVKKGKCSVPDILSSLPDGVAQVNIKPGKISVCWNEQGLPEDVEQLISIIQALGK